MFIKSKRGGLDLAIGMAAAAAAVVIVITTSSESTSIGEDVAAVVVVMMMVLKSSRKTVRIHWHWRVIEKADLRRGGTGGQLVHLPVLVRAMAGRR